MFIVKNKSINERVTDFVDNTITILVHSDASNGCLRSIAGIHLLGCG
jgi:hypothetical protein